MASRFTRNFIIVSILHLLAIVLVTAFSVYSCRRTPKPPEITTYIDLSMSEPAPVEPVVKPVPEPPAPEPAPVIKKPAPVPEPVETKPPKPRKKIEISDKIVTRRPEAKPEINEDKIRKMLSETIKPTQVTADVVKTDFAWYYAMVRDQMYTAWKQPGTVSRSAGLITKMIITVNRNGDVIGSRMIASSGNEVMDKSVLDAVSRVTKLPQLPRDMPGDTKDISVDFELTDRF